MARKSKGKMTFETPTGRKIEMDEHQAAEAYKRIREGSVKGSSRTRQLIEEGRKFEQEHNHRGSRE